ncbi:hypothetical protein RB195_010381 [Necator americanus]|uniref:Uncharacterized protein n=1 Tax=Necator americanus TaxID=51031 RepID=A0ABR1CZH6_NECAM
MEDYGEGGDSVHFLLIAVKDGPEDTAPHKAGVLQSNLLYKMCGDADENKVGGCAIAVRNDYKNLVEEFGSTLSRCAFLRLRDLSRRRAHLDNVEPLDRRQHVVNLVSKLAAAYRLRLRPGKFKQMWISSRPRTGIRVDGQPIELDEFCYLGCTLKNNGSYERDEMQRCAKATSAFNSLTKCLWRPADRLVQRVLRSLPGSSWKKPPGRKRKFWTEVVKEDLRTLGVDRQFRQDVRFRRIWNSDECIDSVQALAEDREGWAKLCSRTAHLGEDAVSRVRR